MSDLSFHIPGAFAKKEMCYHFYLFPYYTDTERVKLIKYINYHLDNIELFGNLL